VHGATNRQMSLQISVSEILSCVLSCFLGFSANAFLRFHFIFQKNSSFQNSFDYYLSINRSDILKIVENNTKQHSNIIFAITNSANESVHLQRSFSLAVAFRWHYTVEIASKIKQNYQKYG
jgi:hypothetical protein